MREPRNVLLGVNAHLEPMFQEPGGPTPRRCGHRLPPGSSGCRHGQQSLMVPSGPWASSRGRYSDTATAPVPRSSPGVAGAADADRALGVQSPRLPRETQSSRQKTSQKTRGLHWKLAGPEGARGLSSSRNPLPPLLPTSVSLQTCALPPGCLEIRTNKPPSPHPSPGIPVLVNIPSLPLSLFPKERTWNETNRPAAHRSLLGGQGRGEGQG